MPLNPKSKIILFIFVICGVSSAVTFASASVSINGQINTEQINVRVDARVSSPVICSLSKGELVEVVAEAYDWYKIRLPKEAPAYVKADLVECINADSVVNPGRCLSAKVIKERINIRLGPSESSWILGKADKLTVVNILAQKNGWYKIEPIYQSYGWVNKKFVTKNIVLSQKPELPKLPVKDISSPELLVIEGIVSPYGVVLWRKATHKLITLENKIYLLRGNRKGLNELNYHKVKITGKLINPATSPIRSPAARGATSNGTSKYPVLQVNIIEALS